MADPLMHLAEWLEPFTVTLNADVLEERRRLVEGLAADETLDAHTIVAAAHAQFPDGANQAIEESIAQIDASVVLAGRPELAAALAACALVVRLADGEPDDAALLSLLVQSADFIGLEPAVPVLPRAAAAAIAEAGRRQRQRLEPASTSREIRTLLAKANVAAEAVDERHTTLVTAVRARDAALRALASRVEAVASLMEDRLALVEEELDMLWWSRKGRSSATDEPWESLPCTERAAVAADELAEMLCRIPAPPSARSLLRAVLGPDADAEVPIADVAAVMSVPESARRLLLMPLTTYRLVAADIGIEEREAVARVFAKTVPLAADATRSLLDVADQVLRERQINDLL